LDEINSINAAPQQADTLSYLLLGRTCNAELVLYH
jgi:hypothetical protein